MASHSFSSSLPILVFYLLFLFPGFPVSHSNPELYENCLDTVFECGNISIGYPLSVGKRKPKCGQPGLELRCEDGTNTTTIEIHGVKYRVMDIHREHQSLSLRIAREDYFINDGICRPQTLIQDSIIDSELFDLAPGYTNVTLFYDCPHLAPARSLGIFPCSNSDYHDVSVTIDAIRGDGDGCSANVTFPIYGERLLEDDPDLLRSLREALKSGLWVKWKEDTQAFPNCNASRGACGFNRIINQPFCLCPSGFENPWEYPYECPESPVSASWQPGSGGNNHRHGVLVGLGLGIAVVCATILVCAFVLCFNRNSISNHFYSGKMKENATIEEFITNFGSFAPKRYSYGEIKKMTNKFSYKLGQGGFGSVYKGKLSDGRFVAVKILSESKGNGEDFMNEVASISRTSHVNVVSFLGFCFERSKRALIYEFMSRGSLDKFIYGQGSDNQSRQLEWQVLYNIALGIARGLEYLHQGCNTRILHFDIKPHNILLDENFCPKISDFGLSKLCKTNESAVSMACARGTIGYIAPEVFCRNFGRVSYKSDVYSYGMLILEMVGGRKNIDVEVSQTSEYFPTWIYNHLDQSMCLNHDGVVAEEEEEITRKLTIVSLWCIQSSPSDRPSMAKVIEMLQGSLQSLVIPPRPFVSSLVRSPGTFAET